MTATIINADCLEHMRTLANDSVDSIVTDPPYGLSFMGKKWDYDVPSVEIWAECLRVLKPGGHLLAFAGTRTQHRMAVRIEDAGFEIRDMIAWVYGSGFQKSLDVAKEIDKKNGIWRGRAGDPTSDNQSMKGPNYERTDKGSPITDAAKQWVGWGTALKPALEPITVARKPLIGTVVKNVQAHGTGAINIDACRVGNEQIKTNGEKARNNNTVSVTSAHKHDYVGGTHTGRWPANLIHDGSDEVLGLFPQSDSSKPNPNYPYGKGHGQGSEGNGSWGAGFNSKYQNQPPRGDSGSAARFFYCAKVSKAERDAGVAGVGALRDGGRESQPRKNNHPTVKPVDLMRYLCRLVTPPGGVVLDPFMGSGTTGVAAVNEGFSFLGIERERQYFEIARQRIEHAQNETKQAELFLAKTIDDS